VSTATGRFDVRCGNDAPVEVQYFLARRAIRAHAEERLPVDTAPQEAAAALSGRARFLTNGPRTTMVRKQLYGKIAQPATILVCSFTARAVMMKKYRARRVVCSERANTWARRQTAELGLADCRAFSETNF